MNNIRNLSIKLSTGIFLLFLALFCVPHSALASTSYLMNYTLSSSGILTVTNPPQGNITGVVACPTTANTPLTTGPTSCDNGASFFSGGASAGLDAFFSGSGELVSSGVYDLNAFLSNNGRGDGDYYFYTSTVSGDYYFITQLHRAAGVWDTLDIVGVVIDTTIISVTPDSNSTVSSGTVTLGAHYFINEKDSNALCILTSTSSGCDFYLKLDASNMDNLLQPPISLSFFTIPGFLLTTTTTRDLPNGFYAGRWSIYSNGLEIAATTTNFTVGSSALSATSTDALTHDAAAAFKSPAECQGLSFLSVDCLVSLIKPTPAQKQYLYDQITVDFFDKVPFSYVVRFKTMIDASTTNSLPYIDYTFASSSPLAGTNITLNPWLYTYDASTSPLKTMTDPSTGKDIWQIMKTPTETFVYLFLIFMIINDLTHIHVHDKQNL